MYKFSFSGNLWNPGILKKQRNHHIILLTKTKKHTDIENG
jgi:hypothetical protein